MGEGGIGTIGFIGRYMNSEKGWRPNAGADILAALANSPG